MLYHKFSTCLRLVENVLEKSNESRRCVRQVKRDVRSVCFRLRPVEHTVDAWNTFRPVWVIL